MVLGPSPITPIGRLVRSPAVSAFGSRVSSRSSPMLDEIADLEGAGLARLVSPSTGPERIAQVQPRYESASEAADAFDYEESGSRGPVASLFDFLSRGQSAVMGAATGLFGAQRYGEEDGPAGIGEALTRFGKGFSGEEQYRFADFTDTGQRIAAGEEVGGLAKAWNTGLGFVIDTVTDPLTYVSFGGSIMGRMRAAQSIRGASLGVHQKALKDGAASGFFDPVRFMRESIDNRVTRTDKLAFDLNKLAKEASTSSLEHSDTLKNVDFSASMNLDDILRVSGQVASETGIDLIREVSLKYLPDAAAMAYARRSAAGLRRWSVKHFGEDAGNAYFSALPRDIQGGVRIRLPFARNADGTPIAAAIPGIGAGRLGDKSKLIREVEELTQSGRDIVRRVFERPLGAFSGKSGAIYYDAVIASTGKRSSSGSSTWVDFQGAEYAEASRRALRTTFDERFLMEHEHASKLHAQGSEKHGKSFDDAFKRFMYNTEQLDAYKDNRIFANEAEEVAFNVANSWRQMLDEIGTEAVEVFGDANLAFNFLTDYVPRITARKETTKRFFDSRGAGMPGAKPQYIRHRGQWAEQWDISQDGRAVVVRWMPNEDISRLSTDGLDEVYETDPTIWMSVYLSEVRSSLNDQKILNFFRKEGLITPAETIKLQKIDEAETQRRIVELTTTDPNLDKRLPNLRRMEDELTSPKFAYGADSDTTVGAAMAMYLKRMGLDIVAPDEVGAYVNIEKALVNIIDGSSIVRNKAGRYVIQDSDGKAVFSNEHITLGGREIIPGKQNRGVIREYDTIEQARAAWDQQQLVNRESIYYKEYLLNERAKILQDIDEIFNNEMFADVNARSLAALPEDEKGMYIEAWMAAIERFGLNKPQFVTTRQGQAAFKQGQSNQPLSWEVTAPTPEFEDWLKSQDYMSIGGLAYGPDEVLDYASQIRVKDRIATQLVNDFAPKKLMQNIQRMYQVTQAPSTVGQEIYQNFYKPLYAAQKAWMTLGRGPGFVIRNIMGGSWNNWINNVGREQTLKSARMLAARASAKKEVGEKLQELGVNIEPIEISTMYRDANRKYLSRYYSGDELDETLEMWELFSRNGLGGNRESARLYGEILRGISRKRSGGQGIGTDLPGVRIRPSTGDTRQGTEVVLEEDIGTIERLLEMAAGDNWWIRDVMSPLVEMSEDYMRFAAFLKGVKEIGLEDPSTGIRGFAAAQWVKSSQFDYADVSNAEQSLKLLIPFYTWTRYNVPLQIRAIIQQPDKIAQALRIHESLGNMFGEEGDNFSPSYVADRFGITISEENPLIQMLPEWMRPQGDVTLGMIWGEPVSDINTIFRDPRYAARFGARNLASSGFVNIRELANQFNPLVAAVSNAQSAMSEAGRSDGRNVEDAPRWARWLGLAREDPTEPGRYVASRSTLEFIRNTIPVVSQAERLIPYLGGDRTPGRWTTSVASAMFGLPAATVDDWIKASEMDRRSTFIQQQMKNEFGRSWDYRNELIDRLVKEGATTEFIQALNIRDMKDDEVDVLRAVNTWRMMRRLELLVELGMPEDELVASLSAFAPEGSRSDSLLQIIWKYVPKPSTDFSTGVRQFGLQPITRKDLEEIGLTVADVRNMSENEQRNLVYWVNRNKGWTGPQR